MSIAARRIQVGDLEVHELNRLGEEEFLSFADVKGTGIDPAVDHPLEPVCPTAEVDAHEIDSRAILDSRIQLVEIRRSSRSSRGGAFVPAGH